MVTLNEIFDTRIDNLPWQRHGRFELTQIEFEGHPYNIQIEKKPIENAFKEKMKVKSAEVSFFKADEDDEKKAFSTQNILKTNPSSLYGIIANSLTDRFADYEAYYFTAESQHSPGSNKEYQQKKRIYFFLANYVRKEYNGTTYYYENNTVGKKEFIVSKRQIDLENSPFKNPLKEALSKMDPTKIAFFTRDKKEKL